MRKHYYLNHIILRGILIFISCFHIIQLVFIKYYYIKWTNSKYRDELYEEERRPAIRSLADLRNPHRFISEVDDAWKTRLWSVMLINHDPPYPSQIIQASYITCPPIQFMMVFHRSFKCILYAGYTSLRCSASNAFYINRSWFYMKI